MKGDCNADAFLYVSRGSRAKRVSTFSRATRAKFQIREEVGSLSRKRSESNSTNFILSIHLRFRLDPVTLPSYALLIRSLDIDVAYLIATTVTGRYTNRDAPRRVVEFVKTGGGNT